MDKEEKSEGFLDDGSLYDPMDPRLFGEQLHRLRLLGAFNRIPATKRGLKKRTRFLRRLFASFGEGSYIEPPLYASWGGRHVHFGAGVYANFGLTLIDDGSIYVGDGTLIGPHVTLCTAAHPIDPSIRGNGIQYNQPIRIGAHCWLGAGVIVLPGVAIGEGSVIGAGSVVTKDVPPLTVAVGVPCKPLRAITPEDRLRYGHGIPMPPEWRTERKAE